MRALHITCTICDELDSFSACLQAIEQLTKEEAELLKERVAGLRKVLAPGFDPLTWTSLTIPEFVASVHQVALTSLLATCSALRGRHTGGSLICCKLCCYVALS